jgi:hypothetical protein
MSAKELLEAATPLPWGCEDSSLFSGTYVTDNSWNAIGAMDEAADADLVAYAVNRLPDYEAAVDALGRVVALADSFLAITEPSSEWATTMASARDALARLRGTP